MCGIFAYHSNNDMHLIVEDLKEELVKLHHRGPDNTGSWANNEVFMGHTRLSILDISAFGNQPYCFEELVLAFNGEIFNFLELRDDLIKLGYDFVSGSDTEVVIKAFHAFGVECFERFNGMWSLIIYDQTSGKLVISRDRFGQKPLFYSHDNEKLIVASEIQAIIPHVDVKPNYSAISSFLKEGDFNANENTFFDGVFEFPCACYAIYEDGSFTEVANYWDYPCEVKEHSGKEDSEFHRLLDDAVGIRLRTDVEYGVLLSGGCDSTIISGITRELIEARERIKSYTFASDDHDDESEFAQEIASALNFENTIVKSSITQNEFRTKLQLIVRHLGRGIPRQRFYL